MDGVKLFEDRVLLDPIKAEPKSKGGIVLPDSSQETTTARVIGVGPGRSNDKDGWTVVAMQLKEGDVVLMPRMVERVVLNGKEYLLARERDIAGMIV